MGEIAYQNKDIASKVTGEALIGKSLAPFGLPHLKIVGILPTNLPVIESNELRLDNLFILNDGAVAIIDYESDFKKENFVKYLNYIARVIKRYATAKQLEELKQLRMVVIYTADVEWAEEIYDLGGFVMNVEAAYLIRMNSEEIYRRISGKIQSGLMLSEEEMMELMVLPLTVKGTAAKQKMVMETINLARSIPDYSSTLKILAGILTFSDKIIDEEYCRKVKEAMRMTKVERMIYEDGLTDGRREGRKEGRKEGRAEGKAEGEASLCRLILSLMADDRLDILERVSKDAEYREKLYLEYGI